MITLITRQSKIAQTSQDESTKARQASTRNKASIARKTLQAPTAQLLRHVLLFPLLSPLAVSPVNATQWWQRWDGWLSFV